MRLVLALLIALASGARADGERPGTFDYYVLSLSWSPTWCALEGDARGADQCDARHDYGWTLHGLWPQYHQGWPAFCPSAARPPTRAQTREMADIMGSSGLAWYQWKKHGACSGLDPAAYFDLARRAYTKVVKPDVFRRIDKPVRLPAEVIEQAFLRENPGMEPDMVTITCKAGRIQEVRICLSKSLDFLLCGRDVVRDCQLRDALLDPVR